MQFCLVLELCWLNGLEFGFSKLVLDYLHKGVSIRKSGLQIFRGSGLCIVIMLPLCLAQCHRLVKYL